MARIIGIDLGTTNTAVAILEGGRPRVIEDDRGYKVLPSVVSAKGDGRFVVGQAAHNLILTRPDRTVFGIKRLMGRRFDSPEVEAIRKRVQYDLREAPDGGVQVRVGDQWMTPPEVSAVILQVARTIAERGLGEPVDEAVITVPAYFNHAQRKATLEAAELAGIRCDRLLNEPTAAALAYGHRKNVDRTVAVFDLGGGTFDISVLHLANGIYEILATAGDTFLGGEDFDWRVAEWLADGFQARTRVDLREDRAAVQRLKDAGERAKCELSFADRSNIVIPHLTANESIDVVLTRSKLEELTLDLVERACDIARQTVIEAGLQMSDLDEVVLVGGQTRMPKVREMVSGVFGRDPSRSVHPEEAVAVGAAVHAANLGDTAAEKVVLLDVTPFEIGIDTTRGTFVPLIERNARIPVSATRTFATVHDAQTSVRITVRQGLSRTASENEFLGEFLFEGLSPAPRLQTKVDVGFRIDSNGMLHVAATEKGSGERRNITIRNYAEHAATPKLPDADGARLDAEMRARRAAQEAKGAPVAARAAAAGATAGTKAKKTFFDRLFDRKGGNMAPEAAAPPANGGATPVPAVPAAPEVYPQEPPAHIDLADVDMVEVTAFGGAPPPSLDPLDEELLYEETGSSASLGLAGHGSGDSLPMSMDELFGPGPDAGQGDPFGGDPFGDVRPPIDNPFADDRPAGRAVSFAEAYPSTPTSSGGGFDGPDGIAGAGLDDEALDLAPATEEEDIFAVGGLGDDGGVEVFGEDFAMIPEGAPLDDAANPFAGDDHTEIDSEALAAINAPVNLADPGDLVDEVEPEPLDHGEDALDLGDLFADVSPDATPDAAEPDAADGFAFGGVTEATVSAVSAFSTATEVHEVTGDPGEFLVDLGDFEGHEAPLDGIADAASDLFGADEQPSVAGPVADAAFDAAPDEPPLNGDPLLPFDERSEAPPNDEAPGATGFALVDAVPASAASEWATPSEVTRLNRRPEASPDRPPAPATERRRKPARVKLQYRDFEVFVAEYRENLRRGGTFIRTEKPLPVGRECLFEIGAPGLDLPLVFPAVVTFVATAAPGQEAGMGVEYQLDDGGRHEIERVLNRI